MATRPAHRVAYGLTEALSDMAPRPIAGRANPTTADKAALGTIWTNKTNNSVFILADISANTAHWVAVGGGASTFTDVTISNNLTTLGGGVVSLTSSGNIGLFSANGALNINTSGLINFGAIDDTQAVSTITLDGTVGKAVFTGFTIANGATQVFTINSSEIASDSGAIIGISDTATAATEFIAVKQTMVAGTLTVTILNTGISQTDGDITISFIIL